MQAVDWGSLQQGKVYTLPSMAGLEGDWDGHGNVTNYQNQFLLQGKQLIPILGDASQYGAPTPLPYDIQTIMQSGGGVRPLAMAIKSGQTLDQSNQVYNSALNDTTTPRSFALPPGYQSPQSTDTRSLTPTTQGAPSAPVPQFRDGLSDVQKNGINALLGRIANGTVVGGQPSQTDIDNLTYALGPNWKQYVPQVGAGGATGGQTGGNSQGTDQALDAITDHLTKTIINPDVEIGKDFTDQYLTQAKSELGPYYKQLIDQAQADVTNAFNNIGQDVAANERSLEKTYGQNLQSTQESLARRGLTDSTIRDTAEKTLADTTQAAIEAGRVQAQRQAMTAGTAGERYLGSTNMPKLPGINDAPTPILNQPGVYSFSKANTTRDLFSPVGGTTGTLQQDQLAATQKRVLDLQRTRVSFLKHDLIFYIWHIQSSKAIL